MKTSWQSHASVDCAGDLFYTTIVQHRHMCCLLWFLVWFSLFVGPLLSRSVVLIFSFVAFFFLQEFFSLCVSRDLHTLLLCVFLVCHTVLWHCVFLHSSHTSPIQFPVVTQASFWIKSLLLLLLLLLLTLLSFINWPLWFASSLYTV